MSLDAVASGSADGSIILHTLSDGAYERTVWHPQRHAVDLLAVSELFGHLIFYSNADCRLHTCTINGVPLHTADTGNPLHVMVLTTDSRFLVTGGAYRTSDDQPLVVWGAHDLRVVRRYIGAHCGVRSIALHPENQVMVTGLEDGSLMFFGVNLRSEA